MVSTPNAPEGLSERIEKESEDAVCIKVYSWITLMASAKYTLQKK